MKAVVFFFLVLLGMATVLGLLLSDTEVFNPTRSAQQANAAATFSAMQANATQANWSATQTPQVAQVAAAQTLEALPIQAAQTSQAIMIHATEIAFANTATLEAAQVVIDNKGFQATDTALKSRQWVENQGLLATVAAIEQEKQLNETRTQSAEIAETLNLAIKGLLILFLILAFVLLLLYGIKTMHGKDEIITRNPRPG